ncbi:DsbA family protein [Nitrincola tapanii]|uniref:DSBA-like thioredoxin domain-containing protein n=1 Tax=Nitrincola tapanii TaxID=1708751 RepID=A0A5A9W1N8_9GAMM|nr:DsbA family protein [Nitrincola tapanii]KAA0874394.1 hypothetical protein E1H14_08975 [Nitrincola tapanii]
MHKKLGLGLLSLILLVGCAGQETTPVQAPLYVFEENQHYTQLAQPLPEGVAPVLEYFYYGCTTCYQLTDAITQWSQSEAVALGRVPVHSQTDLVDAARIFHTLAVIGEQAKYSIGYQMFQAQNTSLQGADRINAFLQQYAVDPQAFWEAWGSEAVERRLIGSYMLTQLAAIQSTPAFVVQGRYKVELPVIESVDELFALLSYLNQKTLSDD